MNKLASTVWSFTASATAPVLFRLSLADGSVTSTFFDTTTIAYLRGLLWPFLKGFSPAQRETVILNLMPRLVAVSSLTGEAALSVSVSEGVAEARIIGAVEGESIIVQVPHSAGLPLFPKIVDPSPNEVFVYKRVTLGDESTGLYYATVAVRGSDQAAVDGVQIVKSEAFSTPGTIGTFAVEITGTTGLFLHSVTLFTYTRVETQAKAVVVIDNPQGGVKAHEAVRPSATLMTINGAQLSTPTIIMTDASGAVPQANGIPHQLDPDAQYGRLRIAAVGLTQATANVVTDSAYNKPQSLIIQF